MLNRSIVAAFLAAASWSGRLNAQVTADNVKDASNPANKIQASSVPALGKLYPLSDYFFISPSGAIGIGTKNPGFNRVRIVATGNHLGFVEVDDSGNTARIWTLNADGGQLRIADETTNGNVLVIGSNGNVGIGTEAPASKLHVAGTATVGVLRVTGGADIVESLRANESGCVPGTVVSIDPERPGCVRPSTREYDAAVIGVVSGAGGVNPGLHLGQDGVLEGDVPVAVCGRVYVRCSAENGPIAPGDQLTPGTKTGTAMKATDPARAFGAVIGKALTALPEGDGLVLVWITLG